MVVCCGLVGRGACIQSLLVSVLLLVLVFPYLSSREFSGLAPQHVAIVLPGLNSLSGHANKARCCCCCCCCCIQQLRRKEIPLKKALPLFPLCVCWVPVQV